MDEIFNNAEEFLDKPIVQKAFIEIGKWFGGFLSKNRKMKEKLAIAKQNENDLESLKANLDYMEKWNAEIEQELKDKEKIINELANRTTDLSSAEILQSIVGNSFGNINGGINIGDSQTLNLSDKNVNFEFIFNIIEDLKVGFSVEKVQNRYASIPKEVIDNISEILKQK